MRFDGLDWRRTRSVITLPELANEHYVQFARICKATDKGAISTGWTYTTGCGGTVYAKPITPNGWSLTNMMYGKHFVRDGEVRVKAYLQYGGSVYTTSWVHEKKTAERQLKQAQKNNV